MSTFCVLSPFTFIQALLCVTCHGAYQDIQIWILQIKVVDTQSPALGGPAPDGVIEQCAE